MNKRYRKAVFMTVYLKEKNKILYLILKRKLHWTGFEFPKGGFEENETIQEGIIRELKEEAGLKPKNVKKFNFSGKYDYDKKYRDRPGIAGQTYLLYSIEAPNKEIKIDEREHSGYEWLEFEEAFNKLTWRNQREALILVNDSLTSELQNFRKFVTKNGRLILCGKDRFSNEKLLKQAKKNEIVLHTEESGSPFVNIKDGPDNEDIKEAAEICAMYSQNWKKNKKNVEVHVFYGKNVYKTKDMPIGTFGVKDLKAIVVKKEDIKNMEKLKDFERKIKGEIN